MSLDRRRPPPCGWWVLRRSARRRRWPLFVCRVPPFVYRVVDASRAQAPPPPPAAPEDPDAAFRVLEMLEARGLC